MQQIHIFCSRPGMHRGGRANPAHAAHAIGAHTADQLRELLDDPAIAVVIGEALLPGGVCALLGLPEPAAPEPPAAMPAAPVHPFMAGVLAVPAAPEIAEPAPEPAEPAPERTATRTRGKV